MKMNNKKAIIIIAALAAVIVGLTVFVFVGGKKNKKDNNETTTSTETTVQNTENEATTQEEKTDDTATNKDCNVSISKPNTWESNGKYFGQIDVTITNKSSSEIKNWKVVIDASNGVEIDSNWNGEVKKDGNDIVVTAVEYNQSVPANGNIKDIGVIVSANSKEDFDSIGKSVKLLVDGKEYTDNNDAKEEKTEETTEETTEKAKDDNKSDKASGKTPVEIHGKLSVKGTDIVDENGDKFQLKGISTHGLAWFPDYVNKDAFSTFRDDWDANLIRLAMYTHENNGYCTDGNKSSIKSIVNNGVEYATQLGMYVIIDWHVLREENPNVYKDEAKVFFEEMSAKYKDYDNVIYEICNEPNGSTSWSDVKAYAEEIIPVIRKNDKDAIIIVGTPNWSQDVDIAADNPITGYDNIMYAVHFYAATHTENIRNKVTTALDKGLPVFVSEFSICDASGNGAIDYNQADKWFELINKNNMSYAAWNLSNKDETSSLIKSSCTKTSGWTDDDLSETGIWLKNQIQNGN